MEKLSK